MARNTLGTPAVTNLSEGFVDDDAVLDTAHVGDIRGALGTIHRGDVSLRPGLSAKFKTLLAIVGPGLIVMVGDNDAGAFGTYTQAGQNYGTHLLWTLLLAGAGPVRQPGNGLAPWRSFRSGPRQAYPRALRQVLGRLQCHRPVYLERAHDRYRVHRRDVGRRLPRPAQAAFRSPGGRGRRRGSQHGQFPPLREGLLDTRRRVAGADPDLPGRPSAGDPDAAQFRRTRVATRSVRFPPSCSLIIAIVGTTVAPWQLFFQQSYVIDKRITPRFIKYERVDLWIGIIIVVLGAAALFGFSDAVFAGRPGFGNFTTAAGVAQGLGHYVSRTMGDLFAIALLDASIIGAAAVGLATAYAGADVLGVNHSLHRPITKAKGFYACYAGLMVLAGAVVLTPGAPLGLLTEGVQTLAGVLLPSATVFLLLLCNDKEVLGPWVNSKKLNVFTAAVIGALVVMSVILTASVLFPQVTGGQIVAVMAGGTVIGLLVGLYLFIRGRRAAALTAQLTVPIEWQKRETWRMPALNRLARPVMSTQRKVGLATLRGYLVVAFALVVVKVIEVAVK